MITFGYHELGIFTARQWEPTVHHNNPNRKRGQLTKAEGGDRFVVNEGLFFSCGRFG